MEYNSNVYLTIAHTDCDALGLDGTYRQNNSGDTCILEYPSMEAIPSEVSEVMIETYTHEEALALVVGSEWVATLP